MSQIAEVEEEVKGPSKVLSDAVLLERMFVKSVMSDPRTRRIDWSREELREMHARIVHASTEAEQVAARHTLACTAMRYMIKFVNRYRYRTSRHLDMLDLFSIGYEGLYRASEDYDPEKGTFTTYATAWIRQHVDRAFLNEGRTVRIPVHKQQTAYHALRTADRLRRELGHEPSLGEIADEEGISIEDADYFRRLLDPGVPLDAPMRVENESSDETQLAMLTSDDESFDPSLVLENTEIFAALWARIECLTPREKEVIVLRFGLGDEDPQTLEQVGDAFEITRERVRQIEKEALTKLRRWLRDEKNSLL